MCVFIIHLDNDSPFTGERGLRARGILPGRRTCGRRKAPHLCYGPDAVSPSKCENMVRKIVKIVANWINIELIYCIAVLRTLDVALQLWQPVLLYHVQNVVSTAAHRSNGRTVSIADIHHIWVQIIILMSILMCQLLNACVFLCGSFITGI